MKLTTIANATVIGALQPIVVAIAANRVFGEVIRHATWPLDWSPSPAS